MDHHHPTHGAIPTQPNTAETSQAVLIPPGYRPQPPSLLSEWWKQLVAFCVGLGAFGAIAFAVASAFFVTKAEWTEHTTKVNTALGSMNNAISANTKELQEATKEVKDATEALHQVDIIMAAQGLTDPPKATHRRRKKE